MAKVTQPVSLKTSMLRISEGSKLYPGPKPLYNPVGVLHCSFLKSMYVVPLNVRCTLRGGRGSRGWPVGVKEKR